MNNLIEFIDYVGKDFTNFWWSLFVIFIYFTGFLILTLSVGMTAVKLCIKEYFTYKILSKNDFDNADEKK